MNPEKNKVSVVSTKYGFTASAGILIPVWVIWAKVNSITEAADWISNYSKKDPDKVKSENFIIVDDASHLNIQVQPKTTL